MALGERFLVDADFGHRLGFFSILATTDRAHDDVPGLIPFDAKNVHRSADGLRGPQDVDGKAFEKEREPTVLGRPRDLCVDDPMFGALHSRAPSQQKSLELTGVQMPPTSLSGMVVTGQILLTLRAAETSATRMVNENQNLFAVHVKFDLRYRPRRIESKNVLIEFFVLNQ